MTQPGDLLCEAFLFNDLVEELSAAAELHDQVVAALVLERLVQFDDVGVVETLHHLDFVLEEVHVLHELLVDRLDRADSPGCFVLAFLHLSVRSFPDDFLAHGVLALKFPHSFQQAS